MTLFERGFRPFFLLGALHACSAVLFWLAVLAGWVAAPAWLTPAWWHAHEMAFGFVAAAAAGFLLTAAPTWTGSPPVAGAPLAALVALWLAGRGAMALAGRLPLALVATVDAAFLPALAAAIARPILAARQRRNYPFPAILALLALGNVATHIAAGGVLAAGAPVGLHGSVALAVLLIVVVGGRIVPAFTRNALARSGIDAPVRSAWALDRAAVAFAALFAAAEVAAPRTLASGAAALLAAVAVAARMAGWRTRRTLGDPLLWSLHLGYAWVALGLAAVALAELAGTIPWSVGLHALTTGAIGTMVLAVMTRVALGHTGRPLVAPPAATAAYLLVSAGALARTAGALAFPDPYLRVLVLSGSLWAGAYALFLVAYAPILLRPRVEGSA
jgi:uncharacterized protein involved in response to NO